MGEKGSVSLAAIVCLVAASALPARAEEEGVGGAAEAPQRVLRIGDCVASGPAKGDADAVRSLITSSVVELRMFRVVDSRGQELALREAEAAVQLGEPKELAPLAADFILSSRLDPIGDRVLFTMEVVKASSGETRSVSESFAGENDILLSVRRLTRKLFERQAQGESGGPTVPEASAEAQQPRNPSPSLSLVAGTWKGDKNLDVVVLMLDGSGYAILSSGRRMALKVSVDGSSVVVAQNQVNSPDFYRPGLDVRSARIVAERARPWRWIFSLSADGNSLFGLKESVFVTVTGSGDVSLDNHYVRDAAWTRLYQ